VSEPSGDEEGEELSDGGEDYADLEAEGDASPPPPPPSTL